MSQEHWCKVAHDLDSNPKIVRAGRDGREVYEFALRRNAHPANEYPGSVSASELEAVYVARILQMTEDEAKRGLAACVKEGLLEAVDASDLETGDDETVTAGDVTNVTRDEGETKTLSPRFRIVGWSDGWGKGAGRCGGGGAKSGKERMRELRARRKESAQLDAVEAAAPSRDASIVTRDVTSDEVTVDKIRGDQEKRERKTTRAGGGDVTPPSPAERPPPQLVSAIPDGWKPADSTANAAAAKGAAARGVLVEYALEKFPDVARSKGWRSADWNAKWRDFLASERPTPPEIAGARGATKRKAVTVDREAQARREREENARLAAADLDDVRRVAAAANAALHGMAPMSTIERLPPRRAEPQQRDLPLAAGGSE